MTTYGDVINRTLRVLGGRDNINKLSGDIDPDITTLSFNFSAQGIERGSLLSIDNEIMQVWEIQNPGPVLTVLRGHQGTAHASHIDGTTVTINPRYPRVDVAACINDELNSLSQRGLYQVKTADITWQPNRIGYDLGDPSALDGLEMRWSMPTSFHEWPILKNNYWRLNHDVPTSEFPSGISLSIFDGGYPGRTMRFVYKAGFSPLVDEQDDVTAVSGLHAEAVDILSLGAAIRMVSPDEVDRNDYRNQGDTRRPSEVPPGAVLRSYQGLVAQREARIHEEVTRLLRKYPQKRLGW